MVETYIDWYPCGVCGRVGVYRISGRPDNPAPDP